jgi:Zn finger protein HypA/HybF involved in hydrogenase expression
MSPGVAQLHRTLEQELVALLRGASLECLGCGEFVLHDRDRIRCPECGLVLEREVGAAGSRLDCESQAG